MKAKNLLKKLMALTFVLVMALSGTVLTACGPDGEDPDETDEVKIVKVWVHKSEAEDEGMVYSAIAEAFNDEKFQTQDGRTIKMKLEFKNSAETLATSIEAEVLTGGLPDIVAVDAPNVAAYAEDGILQSIDEYISAEEKADYVDSVIEQGTINGKVYALSAMDAPTGLYYNKSLLNQIGYKAEDYGTVQNPWSWKDLMSAMKALKAAGLPYKTKLNLGFGGNEGLMYLYSSLVYSAGGTFCGSDEKVAGHLDSAESIKGIKSLEPLFMPDEDGELWYYNGSNTDALAAGEIAFEIYGPWNIASIKKSYPEFINSYDIMPVPVYEDENGNKGRAVAGCGSWCFGVTPRAKDLYSAAVAVKYLTSAFASELLYQSIGTFPTHKSSLASLSEFNSGALLSLSTILQNVATPRPKMVNYPKLSDGYQAILSYMETMYGTAEYDLEGYIQTQITAIDR